MILTKCPSCKKRISLLTKFSPKEGFVINIKDKEKERSTKNYKNGKMYDCIKCPHCDDYLYSYLDNWGKFSFGFLAFQFISSFLGSIIYMLLNDKQLDYLFLFLLTISQAIILVVASFLTIKLFIKLKKF